MQCIPGSILIFLKHKLTVALSFRAMLNVCEFELRVDNFRKDFCIIFLIGFTPCKAEQSLQGMEVHEKENHKYEKHMRKLMRKNPKIKVSINSRLKNMQIICQRKAFCRQSMLESKKEIVDIDILVTSRRWWQKNATYRNNEWAIVWTIFIWVTRTYVMFCFSYFVCLSFFVTTIVAWLFFYVSVGGWINNSKCWFNHLESTLVHPFAEASMFHKICWLTCPISNPGPFHSFELSVL